jgi:hypothetical protein
MADPIIPQPVASPATDQPNAPQSGTPQIPPPPQGAMDAPPANTPAPAGASDTPPEKSTENGQTPGTLSQISDAAGNVAAGAAKGLESTTEGIGSLISKIPGIGPKIIPQEGLTAEQKQSTPEGAAQWVGYGGENLAEFMLGDEALKGLSMADKFKQISGAMGILEKSPRLMRAIQMGADVGKAAGELGEDAKAAIAKNPMLARLVGAGMDALRAGATQTVQTAVKTGGDVGEAVKQGAETGAASGVLGTAFGVLGRATEKAGAAGEVVKAASEAGANAPTTIEAGQKVANQIQAANDQMHGDFEAGIQKLSGDLKDQKIPYAGSPLQKAATEAMEGRADVPSQKTTTLGTAFQGLTGGSDTTKKMLFDLTQPNKTGDLSIDELVQRRQQLGEKIGQLTKGATSSADRADVQVYQKLRDGIDDTIDSLAKNSGKPEASQDYEALRAAYKDKVNLFKEPVARAFMPDPVTGKIDLDNAGKYLLQGGKVLDKVNTLSKIVGEQGVKDFGQDIVKRTLADVSTENGQINPAKFVKEFKKIDSLPPEVKSKLFDMDGIQGNLDKLASGLKSAANYQKLARAGVVSGISAASGAAGHAVHAGGELGAIPIALGLMGQKGADLLDKIANRPGMWNAFRKAGEIGTTLEKSPAARRAVGATAYGTGNALSNVVQGASAPLSQPDEDNVVYTNQ